MNEKIKLLAIISIVAVGSGLLGYLVAPSQTSHSEFYAPAIIESGQGTLVKFRVSLEPGYGRTLVNIENSQYREDAENALIKAKRNAEEILGLKLVFYDVVLDVDARGRQVGGESAGAMFAVGIVSAYSGKNVREGATMSAGISPEGFLFAVDGIEEKILAAKSSGKTRFVIATQQTVKNEVDIQGIEIIRASNIRQAAENLLT